MKANVKSNNTNKIMEGLRRRPNYDELVSNINKPVIPLSQFPDRKAVKLRNSNWLSQLDGDSHKALESMHLNMVKEQEKDRLLQNYSTSNNVPLSFTRAQAHAQTQHDLEAQRDDELFHSPQPRNMTHEYDIIQLDHSPEFPSQSQTRSFHHSLVPRPMTQSSTWEKIEEESKHKKMLFFDIAKDDFDDDVARTHAMDVDDAEMRAQDEENKKKNFIVRMG